MKTLSTIALCIFFALGHSQEIELELFASGFNAPVNVKHAGDSRLYVVERRGFIKVVNADGSVEAQPFLDIDEDVTNAGGEQGLLALAFHPNFSSNGFFYVNYIDTNGETKISRFSATSATVADSNSELVLLNIDQPFGNHNGGDLHFGPNDGYLYISLGDGGSSGDPQNLAQNLDSFLGKILRIDVDNAENGNNYAIPNDNPFVGQANVKEEIWAYGLRNPWKFSFDRANGNLWTGDVGQGQIEEINRADTGVGGQNYGWRCYEGNSTFNTSNCPDAATLTFPVAQYTHIGGSTFRCSITGGYVYRGSTLTDFTGDYFFADFCSDEIGVVSQIDAGTYSISFLEQFPNSGWSAFAQDINGELYAVSLDNGSLSKIIPKTLSFENETKDDYKLFPNPSSSIITIKTTNSMQSINTVEVFSIEGKSVLKVNHLNTPYHHLDVSNLASGLYSIGITNKKGSIFKKIIID